MLVVKKMLIFQRASGDYYIPQFSGMLLFSKMQPFQKSKYFTHLWEMLTSQSFQRCYYFKDANISKSFNRCLHPRLFRDASSFKDTNIPENYRRCLHSTVFRDTIIFKDAAVFVMQRFYRSLGDAYFPEFSEMLVVSKIQTIQRASRDAHILMFSEMLLFSKMQPFFRDANI